LRHPDLTKPAADRRRAVRARFFDEAGPLTPYVSVEVQDLTFFVSTNDHLGRGLFARRWRQDLGHLERAVHLLNEHDLSPLGSTFVDVGANIGTTTAGAVRWHGFARAVALEPEPGNFRTLKLNLVVNDIEPTVMALQVAVSDREGEAELALSARSSGSHILVPLAKGTPDATLTVPALTLDSLVQKGVIEPETVGLVWVDAAGAEGFVFAGASALLEQGVPIVTAVRPTLPSWPQTKESLIRLLRGYTHIHDLRHRKEPPATSLRPLLDSLTKDGDLLILRR
jgi:FkbM family methyltransferase